MKKYVLVGTGHRGIQSFVRPILKDYQDCAQIAAVCDINGKRARFVSTYLGHTIPAYTDFDLMMREHKPDVVIVTTKDCTHEQYIVKALEYGCDVITEKPMTTDEKMCANILEAERRTGNKVTVTFNYRFMPIFAQIKEFVVSGKLGDVLSVHFEWILDRSHGAAYFRRWHSQRANSGSLVVHKSTHHFDLINWILDDIPLDVNAFGSRRFYGPTRAQRGENCRSCAHKDTCEFYYDLTKDEQGFYQGLYIDCEDEDGYIRDRCLFSDEIDIEDNLSVTVRYGKGTTMSYSLTTHSPYEGWRMVFNGVKGRLEVSAFENVIVDRQEIFRFYDSDGRCVDYDLRNVKRRTGGHGGSDTSLRDNLFRGYTRDPLGQMADTRAGALSIGVGIAANKSMAEGRVVSLSEFLGGFYPELRV